MPPPSPPSRRARPRDPPAGIGTTGHGHGPPRDLARESAIGAATDEIPGSNSSSPRRSRSRRTSRSRSRRASAVGQRPRREPSSGRLREVALDRGGRAEREEHLPGRDGVQRRRACRSSRAPGPGSACRPGRRNGRGRRRARDSPAASPGARASSTRAAVRRRQRAGRREPGRQRHDPRAEPVARSRRGPARRRPRRRAVASRRAAVDFGRPARSATSVTPSGPSASAPSTAKARLMDWTLDTRGSSWLDSRSAVPSYGTVPHRGTPD